MMRELVPALQQALTARQPFVYCRLVATRGSTPQKPGAAMLVFPTGSQAGTLGGGCVEAEVKRRALGLLASGASDVIRFDLDQDYGWDDGLICGGRMDVFVDDVTTAEAREYYQKFTELLAGEDGCYEAVSVGRNPVSLAIGASGLFDDGLQLVASRGPLTPTQTSWLVDNLRPLESRPAPYVQDGVSFLPLLERCRLIIVGGGHVGLAVARLAKALDFDIWVIDDRADYVSEDRFPMASRRLHGDMDDVLPQLPVSPSTYALIITRGHRHDQTALYHLVGRPMRYLGMIGSRRKIRLIFENLRELGCGEEDLARVYAPLGLSIGSRTVDEIAVSICAELVAHRNLLGQVPGRETPNAFFVPPSQEQQSQR